MNFRLPHCLLFDLDGTILDSLPGIEHSVRAAFQSCGLPIRKPRLRGLIGPPIRTILSMVGDIADCSVLDQLERAFRVSYDSSGWQKTVCFADANVVLKMMRLYGYRLFVVSNKPRHVSLRILEAQKLLDLFEVILTSDTRNPRFRGKDEMIRQLMAQNKLNADSCLLIGDTMEDALAAATAGIGFAYMTHGYGVITEPHAVPVAFKLDGFRQFLPLVTEEPIVD